jgi:hypothetical protein
MMHKSAWLRYANLPKRIRSFISIQELETQLETANEREHASSRRTADVKFGGKRD